MSLNIGKKPTPTYDSLSGKQKAFIDAYFRTNFNGTKSATIAGYSEDSARQQASRMLKNVNIIQAIKERLDNVGFTVEEIVLHYINRAMFNPADYIKVEEVGGVELVSIDIVKLKTDGYGYMVKGLDYNKYGKPVITFHDTTHALDQLAKIAGMFKGKGEGSTNVTLKVVSKEDYDLV